MIVLRVQSNQQQFLPFNKKSHVWCIEGFTSQSKPFPRHSDQSSLALTGQRQSKALLSRRCPMQC